MLSSKSTDEYWLEKGEILKQNEISHLLPQNKDTLLLNSFAVKSEHSKWHHLSQLLHWKQADVFKQSRLHFLQGNSPSPSKALKKSILSAKKNGSTESSHLLLQIKPLLSFFSSLYF